MRRRQGKDDACTTSPPSDHPTRLWPRSPSDLRRAACLLVMPGPTREDRQGLGVRRHGHHVPCDEVGKSGESPQRMSGTSPRQRRRHSRHGAAQQSDRAAPSARPPRPYGIPTLPGLTNRRRSASRSKGMWVWPSTTVGSAVSAKAVTVTAHRRVDEHDLGVAAGRGVTEPHPPQPGHVLRRPTGAARRADPVSTARGGMRSTGGISAWRPGRSGLTPPSYAAKAPDRRCRAPRSPSRRARPAGPGSLLASARWRCRR